MKIRTIILLLLACATGFTIFWLVRSNRQWEEAKHRATQTMLSSAAASGDLKAMRICLDAGASVNDVPLSGGPLYAAVANHQKEATRYLLDRGANPNGAGAFPPLDYVDQNPNVRKVPARLPVAKLLLEHGADPNARDGYGQTSLFRAKAEEDPELVSLLQQYGAHD